MMRSPGGACSGLTGNLSVFAQNNRITAAEGDHGGDRVQGSYQSGKAAPPRLQYGSAGLIQSLCPGVKATDLLLKLPAHGTALALAQRQQALRKFLHAPLRVLTVEAAHQFVQALALALQAGFLAVAQALAEQF